MRGKGGGGRWYTMPLGIVQPGSPWEEVRSAGEWHLPGYVKTLILAWSEMSSVGEC